MISCSFSLGYYYKSINSIDLSMPICFALIIRTDIGTCYSPTHQTTNYQFHSLYLDKNAPHCLYTRVSLYDI